MKKIEGAASDGEAYESNQSEGIYTAGIDLPFRPESIFTGIATVPPRTITEAPAVLPASTPTGRNADWLTTRKR